ncbi:MAG: helix-turn-helix domain-containing protein [bacterium]|nr:helix-turn-helix domain-containing protein [bacterium]
MHPILERELQKLGLSDKESKVYLASLQLGPQPVQDIARKAGVNRATTYVMIEALTQKGLMTSFERGKKRYFNAEAPDRLLSLLHVQVEELRDREREFSQVLPDLRAMLTSAGERPRVRFFEGPEGVRAMREEIAATDAKDLWVVTQVKLGTHELSTAEHEEHDRKLRSKGITLHVLYTGTVAPEEIQQHPTWNFREVPEGTFPFKGEISVFGDKIYGFTYSGKIIGVIIENADLAETLRSTIRLAWFGAAAPKHAPLFVE